DRRAAPRARGVHDAAHRRHRVARRAVDSRLLAPTGAGRSARLDEHAAAAHRRRDRRNELHPPRAATHVRRRSARRPGPSAERGDAVKYEIVHRTEYRYDADVSANYSEAHLIPRALDDQVCRAHSLVVEPRPEDYRERTDFFGNPVAYFSIQQPHRHLQV